MTDDSVRRALAALGEMDRTDRDELLAWLCGSAPDAVLAAAAGIARHRDVVARLRQRSPQP